MAADLVKTKTPGIYKRGSRYVFSYRVDRKQRWESCRTLEEARRAKAARMTDIGRGEFQRDSTLTLHKYAHDWIASYTGRTNRGFRDETRAEYQRQLEQYLLRFFDPRQLLKSVGPSDIKKFLAWLCDEQKQQRRLSDATVQRIMAPVKAMFATAFEDELVRRDPTSRVRPPRRDEATIREDVDEPVRAMSRAELSAFMRSVDPSWRPFFHLLATTGVRISEAIALQWKHVQLTGSSPQIAVRQRIVKGKLGAPKSTYGRRDIPISHDLVIEMIERRRTSEWPRDADYVFPSTVGTALLPGNAFSRVLKPAGDRADVPWVGFHTFRHTCAAMLIDEGRNILQISRWLGHHDPGFTLRRYGSLMDEGVGAPLEVGQGANKVQTCPTPLDANRHLGLLGESTN